MEEPQNTPKATLHISEKLIKLGRRDYKLQFIKHNEAFCWMALEKTPGGEWKPARGRNSPPLPHAVEEAGMKFYAEEKQTLLPMMA